MAGTGSGQRCRMTARKATSNWTVSVSQVRRVRALRKTTQSSASPAPVKSQAKVTKPKITKPEPVASVATAYKAEDWFEVNYTNAMANLEQLQDQQQVALLKSQLTAMSSAFNVLKSVKSPLSSDQKDSKTPNAEAVVSVPK